MRKCHAELVSASENKDEDSEKACLPARQVRNDKRAVFKSFA
jgi:hypothetical protein